MSGSLAVCLQVSPSCVALVSQMSPGLFSQMWFSRCCLPVAPRFLRLLSSCLSLVLEGVVSQLSSTCLPQFPFVSQNWFAHCFQVSSICRPVVSQSSFKMLFPTCHLVVSRLSCTCGLPIISVLFQMCPPDSFPVVFHSTPTPHSCLLPIL